MSYRMVMGLWVSPDFSEVEAGRRKPPYVNHSKVDYTELKQALKDLFGYGPNVSFQVPNDTIDQVTLHMRQMISPEAIRCTDFGQAFLKLGSSSQDAVIDVRPTWARLHHLKDRNAAPPPSLLPFLVTATDFEDAMLWRANTRPSIGLKPFDIMAALTQGPELDHEGTLPPSMLKALEAVFGCPFLKSTLLDEMAADPKPAYVQG